MLVLTACTANVEVTSGLWRFTDVEFTSTGCESLSSTSLNGLRLELATDPSNSRIEWSDRSDPAQTQTFSCRLKGDEMSCDPARFRETAYEPYGVLATVRHTLTLDGVFSDARTLAGEQRLSVTCEGPECDAAALGGSPPCDYAIAFDAVWDE